MKPDTVVVKKYKNKTDLRHRRTAFQAPVTISFTIQDIADACGISVNQVGTEKVRGYWDPDNLRSIVVYIARRILFKNFK